MSRLKLGLASVAVVAALLAVPAVGSAQEPGPVDVAALCDSLLGSGTTDAGVAAIDRCLAASSPEDCPSSEVLDLAIVRIGHGICIDLAELQDERSVAVRGVAKLRLLP